MSASPLLVDVAMAGLLLLTVASTAACRRSSGGDPAGDGGSDARSLPTAHLPVPFSEIHLGMARADLEARFPPLEDVSNCGTTLLGGDPPLPKVVPGAEKGAHARCARAVDVGGVTFSEVAAILKYAEHETKTSGDTVDVQEGELLSFAQVRGALRAGAVSEAALIDADEARSATAFAAVGHVVEVLLGGGLTFARGRQARRELCALISEDCADLAVDRVRTYTQGGYSLGQIDADAHSRVVYGKCRNAFLQDEKRFATKLVRRVGAFGGIGLARGSRVDHKLTPEEPASFAVYSSRSRLKPKTAKFGVLVANALPAAEDYWKGAVALQPPKDSNVNWMSAVVWLRDGKVSRALLNVSNDDKLGDLPKILAQVYGAPGKTLGTVTTWSVPGGLTITLDIGSATSLVVSEGDVRSPHGAPTLSAPQPVATVTAAVAPTAAPPPILPTPGTTSTPTAATTPSAVVARTATPPAGTAPKAPTVPATPTPPPVDPRARANCLAACVAKCADDASCERSCAGACPSP